jgi:disease resistance protein RPM1
VTTRIENVAKECSDASGSGYYIYQIKELNPEYSKKLFMSRAFGSMDDQPCPEGLEDIMKSILKKCAGLPLAIVSIASLLRNYKYPERKDMWYTICNSIGSQMESNPSLEGMNKILTLSYSHLPYHLKGCMMYLVIFPEDFEINKNRLLYRWIAERLVEEKRGLTLMEVAESYFDELISRSMISPVFHVGFHGNRIEACRVHDMMLEVLVSKSLEANFVSLVGGQFEGMSYGRVRRLTIQGGVKEEAKDYGPSKRRRGKEKITAEMMMDLQHVRSLTSFDFQGQKLFDRLGEFTLLRVLDLEDCKGLGNKHVKDICRMYLLKFLSLKGTDISKVPKEVGDLEHLQVLDVRDTGLRELPETVTKLEKVERLDLCHWDSWDVMWTIPRGLSRMKALREVERAKVDNRGGARLIQGYAMHTQYFLQKIVHCNVKIYIYITYGSLFMPRTWKKSKQAVLQPPPAS